MTSTPDPAAGTDLETTVKVEFERYTGKQSWTDLASGAAVVPGSDLIPGNLLVGVPFVIHSVTFRESDNMNAATKTKPYYASIEIVTGDETAFAKALKRNRITDQCPVEPGEELIFNEGGTGVYRQLVRAMEAFGWIVLPEGPMEGPYGESRLDTPPTDWTITADAPDALESRFTPDGASVISAPIWLLAKRGLRRSEYENDYTKEGVTRYLA